MGYRLLAFIITSFFLLDPAGSALAQSPLVDFADLEGHAVAADLHREQLIQREGRTVKVRFHQDWTLYVNDEHYIVMRIGTTAQTPRGTRKAKPNSGSFALDEPVKLKSRGGGEGMFKFADGVLTFMRTFPAGAYRAEFAFQRSGASLTCKVTEAFAREPGKELKLESPFGGEITILNSKQLPSTCKVAKRQ
jgi:hypothetical protein